MYINTVIVGGNVLRHADYKVFSGSSVAEFTIAVNRKFKAADGQMKEECDFIAVVAWGPLSIIARDYLRKGSACIVEGRLKQVRWESSDGKEQSKTKVYAEKIQLIGSKPQGGL